MNEFDGVKVVESEFMSDKHIIVCSPAISKSIGSFYKDRPIDIPEMSTFDAHSRVIGIDFGLNHMVDAFRYGIMAMDGCTTTVDTRCWLERVIDHIWNKHLEIKRDMKMLLA